MGHRYPQPDNEDGFEQLCLRFYRKLWKNESLKLYGKRGERQDGVDVFDPLSIAPVKAVQCKHHEFTKTISPSEINAEVKKAEGSRLGIEHFVIATTAKKSRNAQDTVAELNRREDKKFIVDIHFWEDICEEVGQFGRVKAELIIYGENILAGAIEATSSEVSSSSGITSTPESAATVVSPDTPVTSIMDISEELEQIEKLLDDRDFEAARQAMADQPDEASAKSLALTDQYMLLRFRARLALEDGKWDSAGKMFIDAYQMAPDSNQAKQNQVLGFCLIGDKPRAYAAAVKHISDGVKTKSMALRLIECIGSLDELAEHASLFDLYKEDDTDINVALCHKHLELKAFDAARKYGQHALSLNANSPHAYLAMAMTLHRSSVEMKWNERVQNLRRAIDHYDAGEKNAAEQNFPQLLPKLYVNRAAARMLLGQPKEATSDYRAAIQAAQNPSVYAARAIEFFLQAGEYESAWQLLHHLDTSTPEGQYLTLVTEYHYGDDEDRKAALDKMETLAAADTEREVDCRSFCVQWALDLKEYDTAVECVPDSFQKAYPFQAHSLLAWISLEKGEEEKARKETESALASSVRSAHRQDLRLLGITLVRLGDDKNAIGLLEQVATPGILDDEMKRLISCAQRLERHDLLLRLCEELRESGTQDDLLRTLELQLLSLYNPEKAFELSSDFIAVGSTPEYFRAFRNYLIVRLTKPDQLELDPTELPTPEQIGVSEAELVMLPYIRAGRFDDGLRFVHSQLRRFFENELAHGRYIFFFLTYASRTSLITSPDVIEPNCAVHLEVEDESERWVIIEDDHPVASRDEFPSTNVLCQRLIGRKIGDSIALPGNLVQSKTATVKEIQTKFVRAFQDSTQKLQRRFPDTSVLQMVNLGTEDEFDASAIVTSLEGRRNHIETCFEIYRDHAVSLHLLADRLGVNELETILALADHEDVGVKCCHVTPSEYEQFARHEESYETFVLDLSAILTLTLLDGWSNLDNSTSYFVSQSTSEKIDSWIHRETELQSVGYVRLDESGQLVLREVAEEERKQKLEYLQKIRELVDQHCEKKSSIAVAKIAPEKRVKYEKLVGMHNIESISVASETDGVLWSDDFVVGFLGKTDFGVEHVWTQLAIQRFANNGKVTTDAFDLTSAKLASWGYGVIIWNADTIVAAGRESKWNTDSWPLKQCIGLIGRSTLPISLKSQLVLEFFKLLLRSECIELKQSAVIRACLDVLDSPKAVRWMNTRIDSIFSIDFPSAEFLRIELEFWLRNRLIK